MARVVYDCSNLVLRNENYTANGPVICTPDAYWPDKQYCCTPHCCSVVQRKPTRHLWEAWYFWLGLALLVVFLLTSVSSYLFSSCKHNLHSTPFGFMNQRSAGSADNQQNNNGNDTNHISINVIATPEPMASHRKMVLVAPRPSLTHMTPIVA